MRQMCQANSTQQNPQHRALKLCLHVLLCTFIACGLLSFGASAAHANNQIFSNWFTNDNEELDANELTLRPQDQVKNDKQKHQAAFGQLVYLYFQEDYQNVLKLIEVGNKKHGFSSLDKADIDRLNLIQGASQLQLGLYQQSQAKFASLLSQTSSDYVQANTWFFMARAGFENKQAYLTEQAYLAIQQGNLREHLSRNQWYELIYLTAFTRMQLVVNSNIENVNSVLAPAENTVMNDGVALDHDWQSLHSQIPKQNIYHAYLLANHATNLFNQGNYELASTTFAQAKQALIAYQNRRGFIQEVAKSIFDSVTWLVRPWTWFDGNATAQKAAKKREQSQEKAELDALFDRINVGLGQSLLQQGDLENAIAVIQNISVSGGDAEQALLSYGWANARENRWQAAMAAWQYLQQNSVGLFSLQASYGLAYAFGQQDNLGQAFFALRTTAQEIDRSLLALDKFSQTVQQAEFFSQYNKQWPASLRDLKLGFFAPSQSFDAQYLLSMRQQANEILQDIDAKKTRLSQLTQMLNERQQAYSNRSNTLSLAQAQAQIVQTQTMIDSIHSLLNTAASPNNFSASAFTEQVNLGKRMASNEMRKHITRLDEAWARHTRLKNDNTRKRPLRASYQERLQRLQGLITWNLMDDFIAKKWQHQGLLKGAQSALTQAKAQYARLQKIQQAKDAFTEQNAELASLAAELKLQTQTANEVYQHATNALVAQLLNIIDSRILQLEQQRVNTRLAMLRIQDLRQRGGQ